MKTSIQNPTLFLKAGFLTVFTSVLFTVQTFAATYTSAQSGNWNSLTTWSVNNTTPANLPGSNDDVIISSTHSINAFSGTTIKSLSIGGSLTVNIPNTDLFITNVLNNSTSASGTLTILGGKLRVEKTFSIIALTATIDGSTSSIIYGEDTDILRSSLNSTTEYITLNNGVTLVLENLGKGGKYKRQDEVLFPIGTSGDYNPIYINNKDFSQSATTTGDFAVTLQDNVYINGFDGLLAGNAVNKTWSVNLIKGEANAIFTFRWNASDELGGFLPSQDNELYQLKQNPLNNNTWEWFSIPSTVFVFSGTTAARTITHTVPFTGNAGGYTPSGQQNPLPITPVSFSKFTIFDGGPIVPLPVELISFSAIKKNTEVALTWETASEKNCQGFEIQTSADGKNYKALDFINSQNGNSATTQRYAYTHKTGNREGLIYYRLKQVDLDGTVSFYHAKVVDLGRFTNAAAIFPNPFQDKFKLELQATEVGNAEIVVKDLTGRTIVHQQPILVKGTNTIDISLKDMPSGVYLINATAGGHTYTNRIVKQ